jgi:HSP20 family protein
MARQSGGRASSSASSRSGGGRSSNTGGSAGGGGRGTTARGSRESSTERNDAAAQNIDQSSDRERQLGVSREGGSSAESGTGASVQSRTQRGLQSRGGQQSGALGGRSQASVLPALMANPWIMTNAFLTNPYGFAQALNQEMDRLFSSQLADVGPASQVGSGSPESGRGLPTSSGQWNRGVNQWAPQLEVRQRGNEITICADLPGMKADDVSIEIEDGVLTISGERQQKSENREEGFYRSERSYGSFTRSIALPEGVDEREVQARFEDGVLEVTVPVPEQRQRGRKIEIQTRKASNSADQSGSTSS